MDQVLFSGVSFARTSSLTTGFGCDIFGRKWAFNLTIGITSVFGLISAGSPNFAAICTFAALWSVGVGGYVY